jgi:hypothetical protein
MLAGAYTFKNTPTHPGGGGNISRCYLGEKYEKGEEKKGVYVKEKGRKRLGSKRGK